MERLQQALPHKFGSFSLSSGGHDGKPFDRSLSLGHVKLGKNSAKGRDRNDNDVIQEEEEIEEEEDDEEIQNLKKEEDQVEVKEEEEEAATATESKDAKEPDVSFASISADIDEFIGILLSVVNDGQDEPPAICESTVEKFLDLVDKTVTKHETGEFGLSTEHGGISLFEAIDRVAKLMSVAENFVSETKYKQAVNRAGGILHRAMCFLEEEFYALLDDPKLKQDPGSTRPKVKVRAPSFGLIHELTDRCQLPPQPPPASETKLTVKLKKYPPEAVEMLRRIASGMISGGYATECCQVFTIARRNAFDVGLSNLGYEKLSIDDVVKMSWESLEGEIATWIKVFRQSVEITFSREHDLCGGIFAGHEAIAYSIFHNLARGAIIPLLTFAEAVTITKRSAEKLFKVLDMYEALRDMMPKVDALLQTESQSNDSIALADLKTEIASIRSRLGEVAVAMFCDLESSIKNDMGKANVPGGAVHPLTRYVMNYLKYACEYRNTMEQVFRENMNPEKASPSEENGGNGEEASKSSNNNASGDDRNPFAAQLVEVMDLLHSNLESKSKLYKDPSLCSIFLMNNGRYIMQKIKGSSEIHQLMGDKWCRKRSTELRQYHKNYQRETWSKVLGCFKDAGLQVKGGGVAKPVLKERLKSFNSMFEEIHKTQSMWVISDEQLQSELRVSVSAVIVPAYRSFLGRFAQHLDPGRQTEKYIKFGPEELENYIDELFSGNPSSMVGRKRT